MTVSNNPQTPLGLSYLGTQSVPSGEISVLWATLGQNRDPEVNSGSGDSRDFEEPGSPVDRSGLFT